MSTLMRKIFRCAWCFEINEILVDLSAGKKQEYVEECQVCCRPNTMHIRIDPVKRFVTVENELEG